MSGNRRLDLALSKLKSLPRTPASSFKTIVYAAAAGGAAVLFMICIDVLFSSTFISFSARSTGFFPGRKLCHGNGVLPCGGHPDLEVRAGRSGQRRVPQLKAAYWKEVGYVPWRSVVVRFIAGVLSIGAGASLGRGGHDPHRRRGGLERVRGYFGTPVRQRRSAVVVGASASIAAAFNAPLAAIAFILEEIVGDINSRFVGRIVLSSVIGAFVVFALVGSQPAFRLLLESVSILTYLIVPVVALVASLLGVVFQRVGGPLPPRAGEKTCQSARMAEALLRRVPGLGDRGGVLLFHRQGGDIRLGL